MKLLSRFLFLFLVVTSTVRAEAVSDVMVGYSATWRAGMGGTDQTKAAIYNQIAGANNIAAASGSPHRQNVIGTKESAHDPTNELDCGAMIGWMRDYNVNIRDVMDAGNALGADLFVYIGDMYDNGAAAQAEQPGRFSCYEQAWWWQNVAAHESGGHNFGLDHGEDRTGPTLIMMHNYCGGGSQGFYSNPNIWLNGVQLIGGMSGCTYVGGSDSAYHLSNTAQGRADLAERKVWGSWLGAPRYRWQFNRAAAAAPAGTTITDSVSGAVATVRGQGATFTGTGLRLPGGTTGNAAANSIAAYVDLPNGIFSAMPNFTIEIWATPLSAKNWMRVIDIGRTSETGDGLGATGEYTGTPGSPAPGGTSSYDDLMLSASIGTDLNSQRFEAKLGGTAVTADSNLGTTAGEPHHYAITFADATSGATIKWFRDGVLVKTLNTTFHSASLQDVNNWLGRSQWSGDDMANIEYHDIRIQNAAIADAEVAGNYRIGRHDAISTMWASDGYGNSGFTNGAWEFGGTPVSTRDYEIGTMMLRSPFNGNSTFPGRSLSLTGGKLHLNGNTAKTTTIADLRLNGGEVGSFAEGGATQTLAGQISLSNWNVNQMRGGWGPMVISANITGLGILLYTENAVTLTANNSGYTGATWIGDGRFSTLKISSETNLGANPPWYGGDWLSLNRGILETTATMVLDDANRGVRIGPSGGFLRPAAGTTLTIANPVSSPAAGNTLQTTPMDSNPIAGILFKDGAGTLVLTCPNNSHNGEMQILDGILRIDGAGRLNNGDHWMPVTLNSTLNYNSTATQTLRGVLSGTGSLIKNNTGTLNLNGSNPFAGSVTINAGTLYTNPANAANNRALSFTSGITVNNGGTLKSGFNGLFGWDGTQPRPITVNTGGLLTTDAAGTDVNVGTITLNGGTLAGFSSPAWGSWNLKRVAGAKLLVTDNSAVIALNVGLGSNNSIDVAAGKTLTFSGTITDLTSEGVCAMVKSGGTGTLLLANTNTYTGVTNVNTGMLKVNGSIAAGSAVTVASGATLSGTGTINGTLTFNAGAIHAPGDASGTQTIGGALSYAATTRVKSTLSTNSNAIGAAGRIAAGNVTVTSGAVIDFILNAAGSTVNFTDPFWSQTRTWNVLSCSNKTGNFTLGTVTADAGGRTLSTYGTLAIQQGSTSVALIFTPYTATELWRQANFGVNWNNPAISGDNVDGDKDGLSNLLEYVMGSNPNSASSGTSPQVSTSGGKLRIAFNRNSAASDVSLYVKATDNLASPWSEIARSVNGVPFSVTAPGAAVNESGSGAVKSVQATDIYLTNDSAHPKRFMRLEVTR